MKKLVIILSLVLLLLPGCNDLSVAQKEATEAIQNVSNEAIRIKNNVETTAVQVKDAIDSVNTALGSAQDAIESVQDIGSEFTSSSELTSSETDENTNDPALSSED